MRDSFLQAHYNGCRQNGTNPVEYKIVNGLSQELLDKLERTYKEDFPERPKLRLIRGGQSDA